MVVESSGPLKKVKKKWYVIRQKLSVQGQTRSDIFKQALFFPDVDGQIFHIQDSGKILN